MRHEASTIASLLLVGLAAGFAVSLAQTPLHPDTVYVNGTVITMDGASRTVEAVALRGEAIVATGSNNEIRALAGATTRVVDLGGKTLVPGFYAAHDHFPGAGDVALHRVNLSSSPFGPVREMKDIIAALREKAQHTPKGQWIVGRGWMDMGLREKRHPTRYDLDEASVDHPIIITHVSGHLVAANSKALALAHITRDTAQPNGGVIRKDPKTGEPDGVLEENAAPLVSALQPPSTAAQAMEAIKWADSHYASKGVTTTVIAGGSKRSIEDLQAALAKGLLRLRVVTMGSKPTPERPSMFEAGGLVSGFGDNRLKLGAVKLVYDGSSYGYTIYLTKPYHTPFKPYEDKPADPTYRGYPRWSRTALTETVRTLNRAGYQIAIHALGDAAIDDAIYALREAQKDFPRPDARHRLEHAFVMREDQLDEIKALGLTPSYFHSHVYYWGDHHRDVTLGPERGARISPLKSTVDRAIRFTMHDDTPVIPVNPLLLVWSAVNRLTLSRKVLGPEQRITPLEALRAITIDAAWQNFEERIKGSIEPGKLADFVILADNPLTVDPVKIKDIPILETIVGGRTTYTSEGGISSAKR